MALFDEEMTKPAAVTSKGRITWGQAPLDRVYRWVGQVTLAVIIATVFHLVGRAIEAAQQPVLTCIRPLIA